MAVSKVGYKEPRSYFTKEMLAEAEKWEREKKAKEKQAQKKSTTAKK